MIIHDLDVEELARARSVTDGVFDLVQPDSLYERPIPLRHRLIFYVGHLEAFDWNLVVEHGIPLKRFDAGLDRLFAFGIDPEPGKAPADEPGDWPEIARVQEYRDQARDAIDNVWSALPSNLQQVCVEHRLMHAETIAYLLHNMDTRRLVSPGSEDTVSGKGAAQDRVAIPAGTATLGKRRGDGFGWDNEFEQVEQPVESFSIDRYKVSNRDYLAFVEAGASVPHFWRRTKDAWFLRRMFDYVPLPLDSPVWVTRNEALAYANWKGAALPTEAQWHRAAYATAGGRERTYPWGDTSPIPGVHGNFGAHRWDASAVDAYPHGASAFGVDDLMGNGWEWTDTPFAPFPGFRSFDFYPGYSSPFFDGLHYVMKGGSPRTDPVFLRRSFRNWFRSDYPYVFAGFRCLYKHK